MFSLNQTFESGGFSLLANLDPDLELAPLDVPLAPPKPEPTHPLASEIAPLEPLAQSSSRKITFDPDPSIPLFFPTDLEQDEKSGQGFWRQGNDEEMREIWQRDKLELTREWKRRHREARKQRRRRGGVGVGEDLD